MGLVLACEGNACDLFEVKDVGKLLTALYSLRGADIIFSNGFIKGRSFYVDVSNLDFLPPRVKVEAGEGELRVIQSSGPESYPVVSGNPGRIMAECFSTFALRELEPEIVLRKCGMLMGERTPDRVILDGVGRIMSCMKESSLPYPLSIVSCREWVSPTVRAFLVEYLGF